MTDPSARIARAGARLVRVPVDPPRGDAIQQFAALELPIVELADVGGHRGMGFGYTIGSGGAAILALLEHELLPAIRGEDSRFIATACSSNTSRRWSRCSSDPLPEKKDTASRSTRPATASNSIATLSIDSRLRG